MNHIHAKISSKLQKKIIAAKNEAHDIVSLAKKRKEEVSNFQKRGIDVAYHFEERDDISLENREEYYPEVYERDIYERYDLD